LFELNDANLDNEILLQQIEELESAYLEEIRELNDGFTIEKDALQNQMNYETNYQLDELRKY